MQSNDAMPLVIVIVLVVSGLNFFWKYCTHLLNLIYSFPGKFFQTEAEKKEEFNPKPKAVILSSADPIFNNARDLNFNAVGPYLSKKVRVFRDFTEIRKRSRLLL